MLFIFALPCSKTDTEQSVLMPQAMRVVSLHPFCRLRGSASSEG